MIRVGKADCLIKISRSCLGLKFFKKSNRTSTRSAPSSLAFLAWISIWSTVSAITGAHISVELLRAPPTIWRSGVANYKNTNNDNNKKQDIVKLSCTISSSTRIHFLGFLRNQTERNEMPPINFSPIMTYWLSCATLYSFKQSKLTRTLKPKTPSLFSFDSFNFLNNRPKNGKTNTRTYTDTGSEREVLPERCRESLCVRAWCLSREGGEPLKVFAYCIGGRERERVFGGRG